MVYKLSTHTYKRTFSMRTFVTFILSLVLATQAEDGSFINAVDFFNKKYTKPAEYSSRIINGNPAIYGLLPWQVRIISRNFASESQCGGSLISDRWVVTSATCVNGATSFTLYLGGITPDTFELQRLEVNSTYYITHYDFNPANFNYDVGVIQLPYAVPLDGYIWPIRLPRSDETLRDTSNVIVSGFGSTSDNSATPSYLQYVHQDTISNTECADLYGTNYIIDATLCAVRGYNEGPCFGDGGGPLVYYDLYEGPTLHGVLSFLHSSGCSAGRAAGYVRVQRVESWIRGVTGVTI